MSLRFNFLWWYHNWNKHTSITMLWLIRLWIYPNFLVRFFSYPPILSLKDQLFLSLFLLFFFTSAGLIIAPVSIVFLSTSTSPLAVLGFLFYPEDGERRNLKIPIYQATWRNIQEHNNSLKTSGLNLEFSDFLQPSQQLLLNLLSWNVGTTTPTHRSLLLSRGEGYFTMSSVSGLYNIEC